MRNDKGKNTRATAAGNLAAGFKKRFTNGSEVLTFGGGARDDDRHRSSTNALLAFVAKPGGGHGRAGDGGGQGRRRGCRDAGCEIALIDDAIELQVRFTFGASPRGDGFDLECRCPSRGLR